MKWKECLQEHQKEAYSEKETACMKEESTKYQLLETLKKEEVPGPFVYDEEVRDYVNRGVSNTLLVI